MNRSVRQKTLVVLMLNKFVLLSRQSVLPVKKQEFMNTVKVVAVHLLIVTTGVLIAFEIKRLRDRAKLKPPAEVK